MKIRVKLKEALIKYFNENGYRKSSDGDYGTKNLLFTEEMFCNCGKTFEVKEPMLTGYHYMNVCDNINYHKDWVTVVGEFHMKEIDV